MLVHQIIKTCCVFCNLCRWRSAQLQLRCSNAQRRQHSRWDRAGQGRNSSSGFSLHPQRQSGAFLWSCFQGRSSEASITSRKSNTVAWALWTRKYNQVCFVYCHVILTVNLSDFNFLLQMDESEWACRRQGLSCKRECRVHIWTAHPKTTRLTEASCKRRSCLGANSRC